MARHPRSRTKKYSVVAVVLIVAIGIVVLVLELTNTTHFFHKSSVVRAPSKPISSLPASSKSANTINTKVPVGSSHLSQGGPTDEAGQVPSNTPTDSSEWSVSASGDLTVKLPGAQQTLHSGSIITGVVSTKVSQVQYRLTDNVVGVISQGPIDVVNDNFTAFISFKSQGSSGRLDVFTTDASGKEFNEVQTPVNF